MELIDLKIYRYVKEMSGNNIPALDDWRRQGQEKYLIGVKLIFKYYRPYRIGWECSLPRK
jgi:hypothetical protein